MSTSDGLDEKALEAAVEAMRVRLGPIVGTPEYIARHAERLKDQREEAARGHAVTAITAYLSALPPRELRIGDFILRHSPNGIWIGRRDGEGGEFATEHVERVIAQFYREQF